MHDAIPELRVVEPHCGRVAEELLDLRAHERLDSRSGARVFTYVTSGSCSIKRRYCSCCALELLLARHIGEMAVDVELAVVGAIDDADVAYPDLATGACRDPVLDRHLPVALAQLVEGGEETRKILRRHAPLPEVRRLENLPVVKPKNELDLRTDEDRTRRRLEPDHVGHERKVFDETRDAAFSRIGDMSLYRARGSDAHTGNVVR